MFRGSSDLNGKVTQSPTQSLFFLLKEFVVAVQQRLSLCDYGSAKMRREQFNHSVCAFVFRVNVGCGPAEERLLLTGLHAVADIYCENCHTTLGWKYVRMSCSKNSAELLIIKWRQCFCFVFFIHWHGEQWSRPRAPEQLCNTLLQIHSVWRCCDPFSGVIFRLYFY